VPEVATLPSVNATLNAIAATLLVSGFAFVRNKNVSAHRLCMLGAFTCSILFLVSYLYYHSQVGSVRFQGIGFVRALYFTILLTHTVLAAAVPLLALITLWRALRGQFERHAALARWTLPIWLYVSVTGVVIYWMLYHLD
jgi:uncharacterized membrane protein YozB (DUF420 family)